MVTPQDTKARADGSFPSLNDAPASEQDNADSNVFKLGVNTQNQPKGFSGTEVFSGSFSEEYFTKLTGIDAAKMYDKMRRSEPQVAMLLGAVKNPIKSASWTIQSADDSDEQQNKIADLIRMIFFEQLDFETFKSEALTLVDFGHSVFEAVNNVVFNHPRFGTFNGLAQLGFRSQKTLIRWILNKQTGAIDGIEQQVNSDVGQSNTMDGRFLHVFTLDKEGDNYEGNFKTSSAVRAVHSQKSVSQDHGNRE